MSDVSRLKRVIYSQSIILETYEEHARPKAEGTFEVSSFKGTIYFVLHVTFQSSPRCIYAPSVSARDPSPLFSPSLQPGFTHLHLESLSTTQLGFQHTIGEKDTYVPSSVSS